MEKTPTPNPYLLHIAVIVYRQEHYLDMVEGAVQLCVTAQVVIPTIHSITIEGKLMAIVEIVTNIGVMAAIAVIGNEYLSRLTKVDDFWAQFQSWVVAIIVAGLASYLGIGAFPSESWFATILYGLLIGFSANGLFDIPITKTFLEWLRARIK